MPDLEEATVVGEAPVTPPTPAGEAPADDFDKERAMKTITSLREFEKTAKAQLKEFEALKAEKTKREQAEMTELERTQAELKQLQDAHTHAQAQLKRSHLRDAASEAAGKANLTFAPGALADALALGLFDALPWEDDKPKGISTAVKDLAAARPYLFAAPPAPVDIVGGKGKHPNGTDLSALSTRWGIKTGQ